MQTDDAIFGSVNCRTVRLSEPGANTGWTVSQNATPPHITIACILHSQPHFPQMTPSIMHSFQVFLLLLLLLSPTTVVTLHADTQSPSSRE